MTTSAPWFAYAALTLAAALAVWVLLVPPTGVDGRGVVAAVLAVASLFDLARDGVS